MKQKEKAGVFARLYVFFISFLLHESCLHRPKHCLYLWLCDLEHIGLLLHETLKVYALAADHPVTGGGLNCASILAG